MNSKIKQKKGISLIVLVITIIVMIIIAAAIILSLNASGVISRANKAKADSDLANKKHAATLALAEYSLLVNSNGTSMKDAEATQYVREKLHAQGMDGSDVSVVEGKIVIGGETVSVVSAKKWTWTDSDEDGVKSVGDLITYKDKTSEQFYIIGIDGDTVKVLAVKSITTTGTLEQSDSWEGIGFSNTEYWSSYIGDYPLDLNVYTDKTAEEKIAMGVTSNDAIEIARTYASETFGVKGRLMTLKEVKDLGGEEYPGSLATGPKFIDKGSYWLGTATDGEYGWVAGIWRRINWDRFFNGL